MEFDRVSNRSPSAVSSARAYAMTRKGMSAWTAEQGQSAQVLEDGGEARPCLSPGIGRSFVAGWERRCGRTCGSSHGLWREGGEEVVEDGFLVHGDAEAGHSRTQCG